MNLTSVWLLAFIAALCALPWLVKWLQKRTGRGPGGTDKGSRLVSVLALGPQQRVITVEVGAGQQRTHLVLGVTAQSITCLHVMQPAVQPAMRPAVPAAAPVGPGSGREPSFAVELKEHTSG